MAPEKTKLSLVQVLDIMGMTAHELAVLAGVHTSTVMRAMIPGSPFKTNETCAYKIAAALGLSVDEIEWANGTSPLGRPADTATSLKGMASTLAYDFCPTHHIALPASKVCDYCA